MVSIAHNAISQLWLLFMTQLHNILKADTTHIGEFLPPCLTTLESQQCWVPFWFLNLLYERYNNLLEDCVNMRFSTSLWFQLNTGRYSIGYKCTIPMFLRKHKEILNFEEFYVLLCQRLLDLRCSSLYLHPYNLQITTRFTIVMCKSHPDTKKHLDTGCP